MVDSFGKNCMLKLHMANSERFFNPKCNGRCGSLDVIGIKPKDSDDFMNGIKSFVAPIPTISHNSVLNYAIFFGFVYFNEEQIVEYNQ